MAVPYLQVDNLTKSFGDLVLFENISFGIAEGQRVGLIAKNGSGKTTLLNIIAGKEGYDSGNIVFRRDLRVDYLEQDPQYPEELTVLEACFHHGNSTVELIKEYERCMETEGHPGLEDLLARMDQEKAWEYEQKAKQILSQLKIRNFDQQVKQLSGGQLKRVALANALITEPDLLILDEPTNHLDLDMTEWLEDYLRRTNLSLLMVTHDRYFLDRVCSEIIEIDNQQIYQYKGNYSYYLEKRQERIEAKSVEIERANNLYRTELDWMRRMPQARGHKARYREDAFYELEKVAKQRFNNDNVKLEVKASYIGSKIFEADHLFKSYGDLKILDDFSYIFARYEKMGIVGNNGTGKSTLLKIVAGLEEPDEGTVVKGRNLYIRYLPQNPEFEAGRTVLDCVIRENMAHEHAWDLEGDAKSMLNKLGITDYSAKVETLSGGQRKRVALAAVLLSTADLLILDEPTNHLDSAMADWLEEYLKKFRGALLMITHDRYFLDNVTNRIVELDKGKLYSYQSGYEGYLELKAEREAMAVSSEQKRQNILRTELAWIRRGAQARSTKQKGRIQRFEALSAVEAPKVDGNVEMSSISSRLGRTTVEAHHLHKAYGDRLLIDDFSYIFLKDDRIGIIGPNGSGKSTLMKMITGWVKPDSGEAIIGQTVKMGYFSQENEDMDQSMRVIDYIKNVAEYVRTADGLVSASQMLERFLFPSHMQYTLIGKLSGGERRRLYLLHILMGAPNVLLLDEPTNDLDIGTLTILEDYLDHFQGIVITVSHDRYFLDRVVRRIFAFEGGGAIRQYEGGYTDYQAACGERIAAEMEESGQEHGRGQKTGGASGAGTSDAAETAKDKNRGRQREKKLKFSYMEQKEWETIEDDIAALEEAIADLEQQMQDSARDYTALNGIIKEKEEKEALLEEKMDRWMYLNDLAEKIEAQAAAHK